MKFPWAHSSLVSLCTLFACGPHFRALRVEPPAQSQGITPVSVDTISATADMVLGNSLHANYSRIEVEVSIRNEGDQARVLYLGQARLDLQDSETGSRLAGGCEHVVADKAAGPQACTQMPLPAHGNTTLIIRFGGFPDYQGEPAARLTLHLPLDGQPPIDLTVVDVSASAGPRLHSQGRCRWAVTLAGGTQSANGRMDFAVFSLFSFGVLAECGSWAFGAAWSGVEFPTGDLSEAFTFNVKPIRIAWFPGDSMPGLYGEGGLLVATWLGAKAPATPGTPMPNLLPHLSVGLAMRLSAPRRAALLPVVHPRKTELQSILRLGYMRWFNTGDSSGSPGMLFSWESRWL